MPSTPRLDAAKTRLRLVRMMLDFDTYPYPSTLDGLVVEQPTDAQIAAGRARSLERARRRVARRAEREASRAAALKRAALGKL